MSMVRSEESEKIYIEPKKKKNSNEEYRNTKKALGGLLGLLGSFLAPFTFLAFSLLLFSGSTTAFLFPNFLKIIDIYMIHHYTIPVPTVSTTEYQN